MAFTGNDDDVNGYNSVIKNGDVANADYVKSVNVPIGSIVSWTKTFAQKETGTNTSVTSNKLVDTSALFDTNGVKDFMVVYNQTDGTWSYATNVDNETTLSLNDDIFTGTGKTYFVYGTPRLADGWVECNGQTLSDADSPFNGATIPDLNTGGVTEFGGQLVQSHLETDGSAIYTPLDANNIILITGQLTAKNSLQTWGNVTLADSVVGTIGSGRYYTDTAGNDTQDTSLTWTGSLTAVAHTITMNADAAGGGSVTVTNQQISILEFAPIKLQEIIWIMRTK